MNESTPLTEVLMHQLHYCVNLMHRSRHRHDHGRRDMHHGQGRILGLLSKHEGINQKDLADLMQIRPASLSELLVKLEREGEIERRPDENDRRMSLVFLTPKSMETVEKVKSARRKMADELFAGFTKEEQQQFSALMTKLIADMEARMTSEETSEFQEELRHGHGRRPHHSHGHGPHGCGHGRHGRHHHAEAPGREGRRERMGQFRDQTDDLHDRHGKSPDDPR